MENDVNIIILFFLALMLALPCIATVFGLLPFSKPSIAAKFSSSLIGGGLLVSIGLLSYTSWAQYSENFLWMNLSSLNFILSTLVFWVSFIVHRFSIRYMDGDRLYRRFFTLLSALTCSAVFMVLSDHFVLFFSFWFLSNTLLVLLMMHKKEWIASKNSAKLAFYTLSLGGLCLFISLIILGQNGLYSIHAMTQQNLLPVSLTASIFILLAALIQSALFPFHRWLMSSLNSPTPVSALMHAGLVNGGGILFVKFAPLMMLNQFLFITLFLLGAVSALLGTVWKLMQHDIKKMLACSTMAQMGFMMMQCSLGLFSAAIAHLCWHGLFKAYLFLSSGSTVAQKKVDTKIYDNSFSLFLISLSGGGVAMYFFSLMTHKFFDFTSSNTFVLFFAFIAGTQLMLSWMRQHKNFASFFIGILLSSFCGLLYGFNIHLIESLIPSLSLTQPQILLPLHWGVMGLFGAFWILFNLGLYKKFSQSKIGCWLYMNLFNASQPSKKMMTTLRTNYYC
jgi:NAD(P)H-quinone oxidoreductase subunit 5